MKVTIKTEKGTAEIYYFDDDGNAVDKEKATRAIIRELDENGELINEIFGAVNGGKSTSG